MGYFALSRLYGSPEELKRLQEECHLNNIGVIVIGYQDISIINDDALAYYDGTPPLNTRMNIVRITTEAAIMKTN